jgi:hypothetical protein
VIGRLAARSPEGRYRDGADLVAAVSNLSAARW